METILDHDLTAEERDIFLTQCHMTGERLLSLSQDSNLFDLAQLFYRRGDKARAFSYIERIQDPFYREGCREGLIGDVLVD